MHEARLVRDLVSRIGQVADEEHSESIDRVRVEIGALSHVTPESFQGQFELISHGTPAEHAALDITRSADQNAPDARDVRLVSVTVHES